MGRSASFQIFKANRHFGQLGSKHLVTSMNKDEEMVQKADSNIMLQNGSFEGCLYRSRVQSLPGLALSLPH